MNLDKLLFKITVQLLMVPHGLLFRIENQCLLLAIFLIPHAFVEIARESNHKQGMFEFDEEVAEIVFALRVLVVVVVVIRRQLYLIVAIFVIHVDFFPQFFKQIATWNVFDAQVQFETASLDNAPNVNLLVLTANARLSTHLTRLVRVAVNGRLKGAKLVVLNYLIGCLDVRVRLRVERLVEIPLKTHVIGGLRRHRQVIFHNNVSLRVERLTAVSLICSHLVVTLTVVRASLRKRFPRKVTVLVHEGRLTRRRHLVV